MSNKYTSNLRKKEQKKEGAYSRSSSGNKTASYDSNLSATKKTSGVDKGGLQSNRKENRGRKKATAPRGKRKEHTKYEHTKKTTKKGSK